MFWKFFEFFFDINLFLFLTVLKSSLASGSENVRFPHSLDFENLPQFRTGHHVLEFTQGLVLGTRVLC